jgi:hypothetical protein
MSTAENLASTATLVLSWAKIRELYPSQWVVVRDIEQEPDWSIRSAVVLSHDPSMDRALDLAPADRDSTIMHTAGRTPRWKPHVENADENRDPVRSRP